MRMLSECVECVILDGDDTQGLQACKTVVSEFRFCCEEIGKMSGKEYEEKEEEIDAQLRSVGIPSNRDMEQEVKSGDVIYVNSYTRSDGTQVQGYFRTKPRN